MQIINKLIELIFPERPTHKSVRESSKESLQRYYLPTAHHGFISLLPYSEPLVRAYIIEAKFHHNEKAWCTLAELLREYCAGLNEKYLLIPVPLSQERERERGYNQVTEVAKRAVKDMKHMNLETDILFRQVNTRPQTSLHRTERLQNMAEAFGLRHNQTEKIRNGYIVLLDDVVTTGATVGAAKATLLPHEPAKVIVIALAH